MDIVIDTSALLAVIVGEPERDRIVELTSGHTLLGPGAIPWEVGNAFSAMLKHRRLTLAEAQEGLRIFHTVPLRFVKVDLATHSLWPTKRDCTHTTPTSSIVPLAMRHRC